MERPSGWRQLLDCLPSPLRGQDEKRRTPSPSPRPTTESLPPRPEGMQVPYPALLPQGQGLLTRMQTLLLRSSHEHVRLLHQLSRCIAAPGERDGPKKVSFQFRKERDVEKRRGSERGCRAGMHKPEDGEMVSPVSLPCFRAHQCLHLNHVQRWSLQSLNLSSGNQDTVRTTYNQSVHKQAKQHQKREGDANTCDCSLTGRAPHSSISDSSSSVDDESSTEKQVTVLSGTGSACPAGDFTGGTSTSLSDSNSTTS